MIVNVKDNDKVTERNKKMHGLRRLLVVSRQTLVLNRAGVEPTCGQVASMIGMTKYKTRKTLEELKNAGICDYNVKYHRPNAVKWVWRIIPGHEDWIEENWNAQF